MSSGTLFIVKILKVVVTVVICGAIVAGGIMMAAYMMKTSPQPERQEAPQLAPLVQVKEVYTSSQPVTISAVGTVIPAVEVTLNARVTGEVLSIHSQFHPGGVVSKDAVLVQLDKQDYELAIPLKESQLETARYELITEQGQQEIAQIEWDMLDEKEDASTLEQELALRRPQLRQKEASVRAAEATLELARVELARTVIKAPFNALLLSREVNIGDLATPQTVLATLVGTDAYWIQASIPTDQLKWLCIPKGVDASGSSVKVISPRGKIWEGHIIALLGDLEPEGLMARVRVEVKDPLALEKDSEEGTLLLDEFVNVEFTGEEADNIFSISRDSIHDGRHVWIVDSDSRLQIKEVETVWSDENLALVRGLDDGDIVITSDLAGPIDGMKVQIQHDDSEVEVPEEPPAITPDQGDKP